MTLDLRRAFAMALLVGLLAAGRPAAAAGVNKTFAFELDKWYDLDDAKGDPVSLHRIQIVRQGGLLTKSNLFRPGNAEYLASIEIRLEYSNSASRDWKARIHVALLDEQDREIDGYNGSQELDEGESHQLATVKLSTLKYGLERARKLRVSIEAEP